MKISICIPTTELIYSNGEIMGPYMLNHLLNSISEQTYTDYEIIISDQSKTDVIKNVCDSWSNLNIKYYKNNTGFGSAAKNLNFAISKSTGEYIKPIFQDDYFFSPNTLQYIVDNLGDNTWGFVGTWHCDEDQTDNLYQPFSPKWDDPVSILSGGNTVSGPSVMFFKNDDNYFDEDLCWLNDVEFYYRLYLKYDLPLLLSNQEIVQRLRSEGVSNTLSSDIKSEEGAYVLCKHNIETGSKNIEDYPNLINRIKKNKFMSYNIPLFKVYMSEEAPKAATEVLKSGFIGQGPVVDEFENNLRSFFQNDYVVTVNSATSGEHLALHMLKKPSSHKNRLNNTWLGLEDGDEVLATPLTCTATNFPILANNLNIKWVDIDPKTLNMDLDDLARKITKKTKIIFLVHWGGYPMDLEKLAQIQQTAFNNFGFKPVVIEDCAHALGSKFNGKPIGTHGNICTFSFQAIKHLTSVDGGVLVLPHKELYQRARLMRWYGIDRDSDRKDFRCEADITEWGFKFHMNDVNAAIGLANLKEVQENVIDKHIENGKYYDKALKGIKGVTLLERDPRMESSYWIYSLLVENKDAFAEHMKKCGIATSQVHERNDIHTCLSEYRTHLPNLDKIRNNLTAIPVGWWVSKEEREYIINCIKKGW